ncbi:hypothetical protein LCGC14_0922070 [marine sediment metagenome]|uniref:DUF4412 domain-containing protein n=1 Tax=marine sediment metagenome TaxID=412755 RepID=A0A0F9R9B3_9ZZZZ|nr:DUF4412 domain-containing protein [Candidatus Aminicenantes bacterium]HEB35373.1 DUF4412 domain-containing protein [Candidatus Aminicenantes bacterium]
MSEKNIILVIVSLFAFSTLLSPNLAEADIIIKKNKLTESTVMGEIQPAKIEEGKTWIAKNKMREDIAESSIIVRLDLNKIYTIDHSKKTYSEIHLPVEIDKVFPPEAKQMMDVMRIKSSSIKETAEIQTIRGWLCQKFLVEVEISMMEMNLPLKIEIWTSRSLGIDLNAYKKLSGAILSLNPFIKDLSKEFEKIEGYPVLTISSVNMMGTETKEREEVVSVEKKNVPAKIFNLPKGYEKIPYNPSE